MHVHKIYKLNSNSRQKHFFQINIPIPFHASREGGPVSQAGLPEDTLIMRVSLPGRLFVLSMYIYWWFSLCQALCYAMCPSLWEKAIDSFSEGHSPWVCTCIIASCHDVLAVYFPRLWSFSDPGLCLVHLCISVTGTVPDIR